MFVQKTLVICILASLAYGELKLMYPPSFKFGAASSSYQVEGAWNVSDKSESIWDTFTQIPDKIADGSTGHVACDSYNQYKRDVEIAAELGIQFYRFSISWPRLLPDGFDNRISEDGKRYYNNLIDELLSKGIEPVITMYHWDLPQRLQNFGGWLNPLIVDWFADYSRVIYSLYADRVKTWITINEPLIMCDLALSTKLIAPNIIDPDAVYMCAKNVLLAHAKAYRIYEKEYRPKYKGELSIANQILWIEGETEGDEEAGEIVRQQMGGVYSHPIYSKEGGWPPMIEKMVAETSKKKGFKRSSLPPFTEDEIELVKGTADYYAFNYYTSRIARFAKEGETIGGWPLDGAPNLGIVLFSKPEWKSAKRSIFTIHPEGLRKQIAWLRKQYGDMKFLITENGYADDASQHLEDNERVEYLHDHLEQVLLSIQEDGADFIGYTFWTLMDNFEWWEGFRVKFGLYEVDFKDPNRTRTPRKSAKYYKKIIESRSLIPIKNLKDELYVLVVLSWCSEDLDFPPGFMFGAATSAYQIEGAWNVSDKSESIWDNYLHQQPDIIADSTNGDVACDSYHHWKRDAQMAAELGLHFYRFSLSWPRLLPSGYSNYISQDGVTYYNNLINELLKNGIEPVVTLYHFDLPQNLQNLGGWTNPLISDWFADYAKVVYSHFADRVKTWITINEPIIICDYLYNTGSLPPMVQEPMLAPFLCNKNVMIAHAKAWRIYDREYKERYRGQISIANHLVWYQPATPRDVELAELAMEQCTGRYSHAIYSKEGGWPPATERIMAEISKRQGYSQSRLPKFTPEEIDLVRGTYDFYAMNHYTSREIRSAKPGEEPGPWFFSGWPDMDAVLVTPDDWKMGAAKALAMYPEGIRRQMVWLKKHYGDINILITENGFSNSADHLEDYDRIAFYKQYLKQVLLSIKKDGINVTGYSVWSLMDNFEWTDGYRPKFGLYRVDFNDPDRPRTPRKSAHYYASVIRRMSLNVTGDTFVDTREIPEVVNVAS